MTTQLGINSSRATGQDLPAKLQRSPRAIARAMWDRHQDLLGNAGSLLATTGVTSTLGFAFWAVAARLFSQQAVGYAAAAVSAMSVLGTIGMFGLGTLLIGELPRRSSREGLISAALLASGLGSLVLGLGFVILAPHFSEHYRNISGSAALATLFCVGVVLTAVTFVFDQATIGLLRGGLQLARNVTFAIAKLIGLLAAAVVTHDAFGVGILMSWVYATAISLVPVAVQMWRTHEPILGKPDWGVLRSLGRTAVAHNWLNLAIQVPVSLIPALVVLLVSPSANAGFYVAWTIVSVLYLLPWHLSTVLFAVAAAHPAALARKLRFALRVSLLLGIAGMVILGFGAHLILSMFGVGYARVATRPMWLLILAYIPTIPRCFYIAVCRAAGRISRAAAVLTIFAMIEVAAAVAGGLWDGLIGLSLALLAVAVVEALLTAPAVLRATSEGGRHAVKDRAPTQTPMQRADASGLARSDVMNSAVNKANGHQQNPGTLKLATAPPSYTPTTGQANGHQQYPGTPEPANLKPATAPPSYTPTTWTAVVASDQRYYHSTITRVFADHIVPFPPYGNARRFTLAGDQMRIGRRSAARGLEPEIDLTGPPVDPLVSRLHAILVATSDGTWGILDPGSMNGTLVNGREIAIGALIPLRDGDRINLGAWTAITIYRR
jgi:O-antigen/teichoic acid export membrane protein